MLPFIKNNMDFGILNKEGFLTTGFQERTEISAFADDQRSLETSFLHCKKFEFLNAAGKQRPRISLRPRVKKTFFNQKEPLDTE